MAGRRHSTFFNAQLSCKGCLFIFLIDLSVCPAFQLSEADKVRNDSIALTRSGGERPFATYKQHYGLARTRFMGLEKNIAFYAMAAMALNIRKGAKFLTLYGLPEREYAG